MIFPRSHCPACQASLNPLSLVPVLGYFFVKGRCTSCGVRISARYPLVEIAAGICTTTLFFLHLSPFDIMADLFPGAGFPGRIDTSIWQKYIPFITSLWIFYTGLTLSLIDYDFRILPDKITLPGILIGLCLSAADSQKGFLFGLWGALAGAGSLYAVAMLYRLLRKRDGLGFGDVKYLGFIGAISGWEGVFVTLAGASMLGAVVGIIVGIITKKGLQTAIPFGPFLAISTMAYHLFSTPLPGFVTFIGRQGF